MIDHITAIQRESRRFGRLISTTDPAAPVPSCPGWTVADLTWHLLEVQYFWASIASDLLRSPEAVADLVRPTDKVLPALFAEQTSRLISSLASHDPDDRCWSWHDAGHRIGWVRRRQAHEALIHRVDAELAADEPVVVDEALATDGVEEILAVMLDSKDIPDWSTFEPNGSNATLRAGSGAAWGLQLGRFTGTSTATGNTYDDPSIVLTEVVPESTVTISGSGADLDLWLWGRGSLDALHVSGNSEAAEFVRSAAAVGTQ